jgi:flagellin-like hook-associated protein FlgL
MRIYDVVYNVNGVLPNGGLTAHATDYTYRIWSDRNNDPLGPEEYSSANHFNMFVGANYTQQDADALDADNLSWGDRGAADLITIQFAQMDTNALLTPYPAGLSVDDLGNGKPLQLGDARAMWDSFAWNGDPMFMGTDPQYDNEDTVLDMMGPQNDITNTGIPVADMGLQGKLGLMLSMIDGNSNEVNADTSDFLFSSFANTTGLNRVNKMRAAIGAWTNRLETTVNNTLNQITNQQSAESVIRDADFATESTAFTRNQILTRSSTAMLAQSNMVPRTVLQLLG